MTAKGRKNKGNVERDVTKDQRTVNRRKKLQSPSLHSRGSDGPKRSGPKGMSRDLKEFWKYQAGLEALANFEKGLLAIAEERFGRLPLREVPIIPFEEKRFGGEIARDNELCRFSVVSLALFDGDCVGENMLFACSGITLPHWSARLELTRFLTSACLVREFNERRNRDDKLRVQVRLPDGTVTDGLLGLYDKDIAIVTSIGRLGVRPVDLNLQAAPDCPDHAQAAGRAFKTGCLMAMQCSLSEECPNMFLSDSQCFTEAALGGPLVRDDGRFQGMIVDLCDSAGFENRKSAKFLSQKLLCERMELFQKLNPKELHFRDYLLPEGVKSIAPSGFMESIYRLRLFCYPMPPPLVLELNGQLLNPFEECFGDLRAWKGSPFDDPHQSSERVWEELQKKVVANICRRVVSLSSFSAEGGRSFTCTGLLIKWPGSTRTIVLTSASLVRSRSNEEHIDENLIIEVSLPPNQRDKGTLEFYNLHYNIAIVSVKGGFKAIRPDGIFNKGKQVLYKKAIAIGREPIHGLLMGTIGEVRFSNKDCKLRCKDLHWSTCKIKKAGIGGPLINFDGSFVGMNFYDGSSTTPFLPRRKVVDALRGKCNFKLPSERRESPVLIRGVSRGHKLNKWPVPKPYWFHGDLEVDMYDVPKLIGRTLQ